MKNFEKKNEKIWFFHFLCNKSYFFCFKLNSMWKMLSLEVLHVEIAQILQILEILLILSILLMDFQFLPIFWWFLEKCSEKGPNELELMSAFRKTWFLSKFLHGNLLSHMVSWQDTPQSWQASPTSVWLGLSNLASLVHRKKDKHRYWKTKWKHKQPKLMLVNFLAIIESSLSPCFFSF